MTQDLQQFRLPPGFRGRSAVAVQLWWLVQATLFRLSPQFMYGWRRWLLRCFGAKVGRGVLLRPTVSVTFPWKVEIGDYAWIGDDAVLYSLGPISIGRNAVVSQKSYLCTGTHDARSPAFDIEAHPIVIEDEAWVASDVFIAPGVTVGRGAVIGARSTVLQAMPAGMVCVGYPCRPVRPR
jgi:putative colanic acid biosynthesis acetyltransferase WcaF